MDVAKDVVELFTVKDGARARELAARLNQLNLARQQEEQRISEAVLRQVEESAELRDAHCLVVEGEGWHRGVIGICASRVVERFGRPAVVIARDGDEAHGSGRSIPGFHLLDALETAPELFLRFGGHAHAVGFAMRAQHVGELRRRINDYARAAAGWRTHAAGAGVRRRTGDGRDDAALLGAVASLQPFGMGNPEPVFLARGVTLMGEPRVMREKHLKLKLRRYVSASRARWPVGWTHLAGGWRTAWRPSRWRAGGAGRALPHRAEHPQGLWRRTATGAFGLPAGRG